MRHRSGRLASPTRRPKTPEMSDIAIFDALPAAVREAIRESGNPNASSPAKIAAELQSGVSIEDIVAAIRVNAARS